MLSLSSLRQVWSKPSLRQVWFNTSVYTNTGDDPQKQQLAAVLPKIFAICKRHYLANPDQTGAEFYAFVCRCAPWQRSQQERACICSAPM